MRSTLQDVLDSTIPATLGFCSTDVSRIAAYVNEATHRLMLAGRWWGTYQRYAIMANNNCVTWPRQVATIEGLTISDEPLVIRNQWFEFLPSGQGRQTASSCSLDYHDGGVVATFDDPAIDGSETLRVWAQYNETGTPRIFIRGYDENSNPISTLDGATRVDGEYVTISTTKTDTTAKFSSITDIRKDATAGPVWLAGYNATTGVERVIGYYEADELNPSYRRAFIPSLTKRPTPSGSCEKRHVVVMAKLEYMAVAKATDKLLIGNLPALKDASRSVQLEERNEPAAAEAAWTKALRTLENELMHYEGEGVVAPINMESTLYGAGSIAHVY